MYPCVFTPTTMCNRLIDKASKTVSSSNKLKQDLQLLVSSLTTSERFHMVLKMCQMLSSVARVTKWPINTLWHWYSSADRASSAVRPNRSLSWNFPGQTLKSPEFCLHLRLANNLTTLFLIISWDSSADRASSAVRPNRSLSWNFPGQTPKSPEFCLHPRLDKNLTTLFLIVNWDSSADRASSAVRPNRSLSWKSSSSFWPDTKESRILS